MASIEEIGKNYQKFDPKIYLQNNYVPPRADFSSKESVVVWKLDCLVAACAQGDIGGRTLVDIGSGPTIYQILSAFELFDEVIISDYLEVNRNEIKSWLQDESGAFDWSPYFKHVCSLEGKGELWQDKQKRLREKVSRVIPVDIHKPQPLGEEVTDGSVDGLVTSFCLEACSPDKEAFECSLKNISQLLKPGGHLLQIGALEESYYTAGEAQLNVVPLKEIDVRTALCNAGYEIRDFQVYSMPASMNIGVDDVSGIFFAWAQKLQPK
ncbi:phenylethanolamine N-methyltransferase-like [Bombina bombina]|uniref:phenylethanolamine N-methyltransferase-like n=1 Tax=Bombina bombina TaxID=8345 RepID=UPI00235A5631|nr:phenylethanolamine N-methyltransferase-like [Bombina bombina]